MTKTKDGKGRRLEDLILLKDLAPKKDPKGGAGGKTVFGELPPDAGADPTNESNESKHTTTKPKPRK